MLFPFTGIPALVFSLRASRLAKQGRIEDARIAGERARDWCWYSAGVGLAVYFAVFICLLFTIRGGVLRRVYFRGDVFFSAAAWQSLLKGFWINIQVFLAAEAIVLVWALVVAIIRLLPNRACAPIRLVATAYCDLFPALPAVLVILIINFGFQRARLPLLEHLNTKQYCILALVLVYGAYVAEVYRAGLESIHPSQSAAARSLGLTLRPDAAHVVVPQAVRRVIPPLLNDFISLQKDTALIGSSASLEVARGPVSQQHALQPLTAVHVAACCFIVITIPLARFVDYLIDRDQAARPAASVRWRSSRSTTSTSPTAHHEVLKGVDLDVERARGGLPDRRLGLRQVDVVALRQRLGDITAGEIRIEGDTVTGPGVDLNALRRDVGIVFQSYNLFPHMTVLRQHHARARARCAADRRPRREERAMALLESVGMQDKAKSSTPTCCPAVSSSGWRSCGRWRCSHGSCCSTRSRRRSTPSSSATCSRSSASSPTTG